MHLVETGGCHHTTSTILAIYNDCIKPCLEYDTAPTHRRSGGGGPGVGRPSQTRLTLNTVCYCARGQGGSIPLWGQGVVSRDTVGGGVASACRSEAPQRQAWWSLWGDTHNMPHEAHCPSSQGFSALTMASKSLRGSTISASASTAPWGRLRNCLW
jgi:hypothetical protein